MVKPFRSNYKDFAAVSKPCRLEGDLDDLIVDGDIPQELDGTFYRVSQDPYYDPDYFQDGTKATPFDGDGNVSAFRIKDGRVSWKQRYVYTERLVAERKAGRSLFGLLSAPFTNHPCVQALTQSPANTNVIIHNGKLLALHEVGPPFEMDPVFEIDKDGKTVWERKATAPTNGPFHDMALTPNYVVLLQMPFLMDHTDVYSPGRMDMFYDRQCPAWFVVIPRNNPEKPVRMFRWKNCMNIHTGCAWEEDGSIFFDCTRAHNNAFTFLPFTDGPPPENAQLTVDFVKWKIDLTSDLDEVKDPEILVDIPCEFPRTDERYTGKKSNICFLAAFKLPDANRPLHQGLNVLARFNLKTRKLDILDPGNCLVQEPAFIPRSENAPEGDGYIIFMVDNLEEHRNDLKDHAVRLPTRVVDVGPSGSSDIPKLVETKEASGAYVALSHCWGKKQIITTTKETLKDRKVGIQWSDLSKTFQDAISLTRNLGIRYVWIDSLCIIQDDSKDWEIESANMGNIYESAYVTLAATAAPDGSSGFHAPRQPPQSLNLRGTRHQIFAALQPPHDSFTRRRHADPRKMPLLSRAWVYQERILSKRVVHFGFHELVFECKNGYICECGGISRYVNPWSHLTSFKTEFADFLDGRKPDDPGDYVWASMIRGYTACALTFDQDRLPALSATATRLRPKMGEYLAGLWSSLLPAGLFWTADAFDFENPAGPMNNAEAPWKPARRSSAKSCPPTWSWTSVEGAVIEATAVVSPVTQQTFHIKVISASTSPLSQNPYGAVKDGRIQVSGPVVRVNYEIVSDGPKPTQHPHFRLERGGVKHDFFQDVEISERDKNETVGTGFYCLIGEYFQDAVVYVRGEAQKKRYNREVTLVLRVKDPGSSLFERVGVTSGIPREWIPLADQRTVTLV
ncbi:hypothetical protein SLS56_011675 [Neofusicoccum ribis]|uniref:Heterokaryon incompatibility domain-containing protein n=1 Tax=Neofusicoccum ribis TaxID=45134 RepID=A0ABR3SAZ5_9PEZI